MATSTVTYSEVAAKKSIAHILKYSKSECIGLLLGSKTSTTVTVKDVIPLFHERVMSGTTEIAFEMVETFYPADDKMQIVGVYDAPLKCKG